MNLTNLFNIKFLKENLKKSKGLLIFGLGILPLMNILYLISNLNPEKTILNFRQLNLLNYLAMIIIPIFLAYILFSFLFKKKSVDFYLSKPISRKGIYLTNIIGGVVIIIGFVLLNILIFAIFSVITPLVIPKALLFDSLIYFLVGSIFVFFTSVLAICLSGNLITSLAIMALLAFLFPFSKVINIAFKENNNNYIYCSKETCAPEHYTCHKSDVECQEHLQKGEYSYNLQKIDNSSYTLPISYFNESYRTKDIIKTLILSIIYLALSYFSFLKRQMENCECGFKNIYAHYIVKTLTFLPICFISYAILIYENYTLWAISIILSFAYYFLYDFITKKTNKKYKQTFIMFIISFIAIEGFYYCLDNFVGLGNKVYQKIDSLTFNYEGYNKFTIKDQDIINQIIKESLEKNYEAKYSYILVTYNIGLKTYSLNIEKSANLTKILDDYIKTNGIKKYIETFDYDHIDYLVLDEKSIPVTKELTKMIKDSTSKEESNFDTELEMVAYSYQFHRYQSVSIPIKANKDLFQYSVNYLNENFIENLENHGNISYSLYTNNISIDLDDSEFNYFCEKYDKEITQFLTNHQNDEVSDKYLLIEGYRINKVAQKESYFIIDIEEFFKLIEKLREESLNDEGYIYIKNMR